MASTWNDGLLAALTPTYLPYGFRKSWMSGCVSAPLGAVTSSMKDTSYAVKSAPCSSWSVCTAPALPAPRSGAAGGRTRRPGRCGDDAAATRFDHWLRMAHAAGPGPSCTLSDSAVSLCQPHLTARLAWSAEVCWPCGEQQRLRHGRPRHADLVYRTQNTGAPFIHLSWASTGWSYTRSIHLATVYMRSSDLLQQSWLLVRSATKVLVKLSWQTPRSSCQQSHASASQHHDQGSRLYCRTASK
jgi:hypothetical protein